VNPSLNHPTNIHARPEEGQNGRKESSSRGDCGPGRTRAVGTDCEAIVLIAGTGYSNAELIIPDGRS